MGDVEQEKHERLERNSIGVQWQQILSHLVDFTNNAATLSLELLDGDDRPVGRIGPLALTQFLNWPDEVCTYNLQAVPLAPSTARSWLKPQSAPRCVDEYFKFVRMRMSVSVRYLVPGDHMLGDARCERLGGA